MRTLIWCACTGIVPFWPINGAPACPTDAKATGWLDSAPHGRHRYPAATPPAPPAAAHPLLDVLAGAALGALLGLLVGLSASPVVGSVVGR